MTLITISLITTSMITTSLMAVVALTLTTILYVLMCPDYKKTERRMIPWAWMAVEYLQTGEFNIMSGTDAEKRHFHLTKRRHLQ
jgi:hypothetical protein